MLLYSLVMLFIVVTVSGSLVCAQELDKSQLAKIAQNPLANVMSFPFQNNTNFGLGPNDRTQNVLNIQPVIPFQVGNVLIITRTIVPVIYQPDIFSESGGTFGLGDLTLTAFFSPAKPGKILWGVGPVFQIPTATDEVLGSGKWGLGPSVLGLVMHGRWVVGALVYNLWSFTGDSDRDDVNSFLLQYFVNYNFDRGWYVSSSPIITANWNAPEDNKWTVPFGLGGGKVFRAGKLPMNVQGQVFYNVVSPDHGPSWTLRLQIQMLFPK
jgi:hypothetical protein